MAAGASRDGEKALIFRISLMTIVIGVGPPS